LCQISSPSDYAVTKKIGRGKYSEVFDAIQTHTGTECVIKVLKPVRQEKIKREISILQNLCGGENIITLLDITRDPLTATPCLVCELMYLCFSAACICGFVRKSNAMAIFIVARFLKK